MMEFDDFFDEIKSKDISISFDGGEKKGLPGLTNEALFHLPLLAITILTLSKNRIKPNVQEIGQLVGDCFERTFDGFNGASQRLGWSANLRVRTIKALTFLEDSQLVSIDNSKRIVATDLGKKVIMTAFKEESELALSIRSLERNYRNIHAEKKIKQDVI